MASTDDLALADRAHAVDQGVREACHATRRTLMALGGMLYEAFEQKHWKTLGAESEKAWLASPGIEIAYSTAKAAAQVWGELVEDRGVDPDQLMGLDIRKVQAVLPAVREKAVEIEAALSDCASLSRSDLSEKYSGDPNAKLDAEAEPSYEKCPTCGQRKKAW